MPSALANPEVVQEYIIREVQSGRVAGPIDPNSMSEFQISRFGVIPKSSQPGHWRLILDLSHPEHFSVNDGINPQWCTLAYPMVHDAVQEVLQLGRGTLLAKIDIEQAFRNVPVHPQDRHLLGMMWSGQLFIDMVLLFGLRSAPKIFCAIADSLEWILYQRGISSSLHYLDDFLTMGPPNSDRCASNLQLISDTCRYLGLPLKSQKVEGPTTSLTFLGIILDTTHLELCLPQEKFSTSRQV